MEGPPSPLVDSKIICAYGVFRWGFIRGVRMGFIWGITLDDHPLRPAKALLTGAVRGSVGIPDSLVHKPVDTSGRAAWPVVLLAGFDRLPYSSRLVHVSPSSVSYFVFHLTIALFPNLSRLFCPRLPAFQQLADLLEFGGATGGNCYRTDGLLFAHQ